MSEFSILGFGSVGWLIRAGTAHDFAMAGRAGEPVEADWSGWGRRLMEDPLEGLAEWIPAFGSLLLRFDGERPPRGHLEAWMASGFQGEINRRPGRTVEMPVRYDGEDLGSVAERLGMSREEVIRRHVGGKYRVQCLGFSPGFPYLTGLDPGLWVPRRDSPRARVPAGSVAMGGNHAGIYTVPSPGGWNLLGTTTRRIFDPGAERMEDRFLLGVGDGVQFVETDEAAVNWEPARWTEREDPWLRLISPGGLLGIQDGGRPGWARYGVPAGGAMDPMALRWTNRLLGNPEESAVLEMAGGGQMLEALEVVTVGIGGAEAHGEVRSPDGRVRGVRCWSTETLVPGEVLVFRGGHDGVWSYLALRGGVSAPLVLGSASYNARASLGTVPQAGDSITGNGLESALDSMTGSRWVDPRWLPGRDRMTVRVWPGPQADRFEPAAVKAFFESVWRVSPRSDRVGYRMEGLSLPVPAGSMTSEPVLPGSVQVPPEGCPIVTMPDGPTVGGYPKLGMVDPRDLWRVAQTSAGAEVTWVPEGWDG